ncbi:hypothetical protein [Rhodococcus qingshengii]|uniref:hypothetical protein n=1 Tax=Rhodococcus qingshengii TaxID=334542 RepID=UPI0035E2F258
MSDKFWAKVKSQLNEAKTAKNADDVIRIFAPENNPYGHTEVGGDGFFAGSGGDNTLWEALDEAGWTFLWEKAAYWWAMKAPDGSVITYAEGDLYRGDRPN